MGRPFFCAFLAVPVSGQARPYASIERTFGDLIDYDRKLIETSGIPLAGDIPAGLVCLVSAVRLTPRAEVFYDKIRAALDAPGSHYLSDFTGSMLQIYSPGQRFALSLRLVPGKDR